MAAGQLAAGRMEFADRLTGGSWQTGVVRGPPGQVADGQLTDGGSSSSVYRVYYCFCEADGAVLVEEFVLSTAFVRLMEQ